MDTLNTLKFVRKIYAESIQFVSDRRELGHPMWRLQFRRASNGSYQENVKFIVLAIATET